MESIPFIHEAISFTRSQKEETATYKKGIAPYASINKAKFVTRKDKGDLITLIFFSRHIINTTIS